MDLWVEKDRWFCLIQDLTRLLNIPLKLALYTAKLFSKIYLTFRDEILKIKATTTPFNEEETVKQHKGTPPLQTLVPSLAIGAATDWYPVAVNWFWGRRKIGY